MRHSSGTMPWKENGPMERLELIREWREGESITVLADTYRVSRKTIYKWIARYESEGAAGLEDQSRAPQSSPQRLSEAMNEELVPIQLTETDAA